MATRFECKECNTILYYSDSRPDGLSEIVGRHFGVHFFETGHDNFVGSIPGSEVFISLRQNGQDRGGIVRVDIVPKEVVASYRLAMMLSR